MYSGIGAIAEAIGTQAQANAGSQLSTSFTLLYVMVAKFPLMEAWMKKLQEDTNNYNTDLALSTEPGNDQYKVKAAADNQQKIVDSSNSDLEQGRQDTIIQSQKSVLQVNGNAMSNTYELQAPVLQLLEFTTGSIMGIPKG